MVRIFLKKIWAVYAAFLQCFNHMSWGQAGHPAWINVDNNKSLL